MTNKLNSNYDGTNFNDIITMNQMKVAKTNNILTIQITLFVPLRKTTALTRSLP